MADSKIFQVGNNFDLRDISNQLSSSYKMEGYEVFVTQSAYAVSIKLQKNMGFFMRFLGLAQVITVNLTMNNNNGTLVVDFSDEEWFGKIMAIGIGWMVFWVPFFTGIYGIIKQVGLSKEIMQKIQALLAVNGVLL